MSRRQRLTLFAVAGPVFVAVLIAGLHGLPAFGHFRGVVGVLIDRIEPAMRRATDIVTGINFDVRAFDTVGEEFILFAAASGVALLLRRLREEDEESDRAEGIEDHRFAGASDALRIASLVLIPVLTVLGAYVVIHGHLTPGGGFQGGVVLAAAPAAILLAGRYLAMRNMAPQWLLEVLDASGAAGYALIGVGGLIFAAAYLENFIPLGTPDKLLSAGTIPLASLAVGIEVAGAFLLIWTEFLDQTLIVSRGGER